MYQFVDRPLETLDPGCRFVTWSMRAWVSTLTQKACPARHLAQPFARWRMIGGLQPFHRLMLVLNRDALDFLHFHPLPCPRVSEHEALVLAILTALARGDATQARDTLTLLVAEDGVGDALDALVSLSAALAIAGLLPAEPLPHNG